MPSCDRKQGIPIISSVLQSVLDKPFNRAVIFLHEYEQIKFASAFSDFFTLIASYNDEGTIEISLVLQFHSTSIVFSGRSRYETISDRTNVVSYSWVY